MKISVIIPTRERHDTLGAAIQTCLMQRYDDMEIIISDNFSQDRTKKIVDSFNDYRIVYINTGKRISMSENWEYALSYVKGDYVTYLGDDDGLLPGSIKELVAIIDKTQCEAISWAWASYFWPNCVSVSSRNLLITPLNGKLYKRSARRALKKVIDFKLGYTELPFLYKGVVSTKVLYNIKEKSGGVFFHSMTPDAYSAIVISAFLDTYLYSTKPYSVNGTSSHSSGASGFASNTNQSKISSSIFLNEKNIPFHEKLYLCSSIPIIVSECFFQARDHFPPVRKYVIDLKTVILAALREIKHAPESRCEEVLKAIKEIGKINSMTEYTNSVINKFKNIPHKKTVALFPGYNIIRRYHIYNTSSIGVTDIYQASLICGLIRNNKKNGFILSKIYIIKTSLRIGINIFKRTWESSIRNIAFFKKANKKANLSVKKD